MSSGSAASTRRRSAPGVQAEAPGLHRVGQALSVFLDVLAQAGGFAPGRQVEQGAEPREVADPGVALQLGAVLGQAHVRRAESARAAVGLMVGGPQRGVGGVGPVRAQDVLQVDGGLALGGANRSQPVGEQGVVAGLRPPQGRQQRAEALDLTGEGGVARAHDEAAFGFTSTLTPASESRSPVASAKPGAAARSSTWLSAFGRVRTHCTV